ncbi:MAG TPA: hypothetical protein VD763_04340 [Candidatus Saccharimonadales bacterium]|nr:hypothetical protein [Candidatus Saccharimonadales bacterium]
MRGALSVAGFVAAVVLIALGAAGIVAGMDTPRSAAARPELTARGDALVTPALDQAEAHLAAIADDVDALGIQARGALAALVGADLENVDRAIAEGDRLVAAIRGGSAALDAELAALPVLGTPEAGYQLSTEVRIRAARLREALTATNELEAAWTRLTTGSVAASRLSAHLTEQVDAVVAAAELGRSADYEAAVEALDMADEALIKARALRDTLSKTVDVSVLDEWLDRNEAYDVALRGLYVALRDVGGRVNGEVRDAIDAEKAAKARLPPDSRGLILIMAEIGRGGMNEAVITIEEARGRLGEALEPPASLAPGSSPTIAP